MQIFDIILMALIVIFLVLRLRGALGRRDGFDGNNEKNSQNRSQNERSRSAEDDNVIALPGAQLKTKPTRTRNNTKAHWRMASKPFKKPTPNFAPRISWTELITLLK